MDESHCHLCGTPAVSLPSAQGGYFLHCRRCDLIFVPRSRHLPPDQQKARYLQHQNTINHAGYVRMLSRPIGLLRQYTHDVRRVLDYGCAPTPRLPTTPHNRLCQPLQPRTLGASEAAKGRYRAFGGHEAACPEMIYSHHPPDR
jgi:hypothetical protein